MSAAARRATLDTRPLQPPPGSDSMAFDFFNRGRANRSKALGDRLPPGQYATEKWPVLHYGKVPKFDPSRWDFQVWGLVENPIQLSYDQFKALPTKTVHKDIHCV